MFFSLSSESMGGQLGVWWLLGCHCRWAVGTGLGWFVGWLGFVPRLLLNHGWVLALSSGFKKHWADSILVPSWKSNVFVCVIRMTNPCQDNAPNFKNFKKVSRCRGHLPVEGFHTPFYPPDSWAGPKVFGSATNKEEWLHMMTKRGSRYVNLLKRCFLEAFTSKTTGSWGGLGIINLAQTGPIRLWKEQAEALALLDMRVFNMARRPAQQL